MSSTFKIKPIEKRKLIFLNGHTHSKNEIFETIDYFKIFAEADEKISIKEFFKKFDNKAYMKKQLSSIFKYLDSDKTGEITLKSFLKSFYPGMKEADFQVLARWYSEYQ
jgi:Ca2+-binding EF-hand superfamily protein